MFTIIFFYHIFFCFLPVLFFHLQPSQKWQLPLFQNKLIIDLDKNAIDKKRWKDKNHQKLISLPSQNWHFCDKWSIGYFSMIFMGYFCVMKNTKCNQFLCYLNWGFELFLANNTFFWQKKWKNTKTFLSSTQFGCFKYFVDLKIIIFSELHKSNISLFL